MPSRTSIIISIGNVVEAHPPTTVFRPRLTRRFNNVRHPKLIDDNINSDGTSCDDSSSDCNSSLSLRNNNHPENGKICAVSPKRNMKMCKRRQSSSSSSSPKRRRSSSVSPALSVDSASLKKEADDEKNEEEEDDIVDSNGIGIVKLEKVEDAIINNEDEIDCHSEDRKLLRVRVEKLVDVVTNGVDSADSDPAKEEEAEEEKPPTPSKRRRTELAKLLEAGSSSFHCATAKEINGDEALSPIHVKISDDSVDTVHLEENGDVPKPSLLVKQVSATPPSPRKRRKKRFLRHIENDDVNEEIEVDELSPLSSSSFTVPQTTFEDLEKRLGDITSDPPEDVNSFYFSFEVRPVREGWYQTYSRQDQGDEILYYPNAETFQLPYEMPISTFYLGGKVGLSSAKIRNGEEVKNRRIGRKGAPRFISTRKEKAADAAFKRQSSFDRVIESNFSRKSPRCHASTKSLLLRGENPIIIDDECSNDSVVSTTSGRRKKFVPESLDDLHLISSKLDSFLQAEEPKLSEKDNEEENSPKKKKRPRHDDYDNVMDRIVASNVDSVLLDCLEDELPSVAINDFDATDDVQSLLSDYSTLDLFRKRGRKCISKSSVTSSSRLSLRSDDSSSEGGLGGVCTESESCTTDDEEEDAYEDIRIPPPPQKNFNKRKQDTAGPPKPTSNKKKQKRTLLTNVLESQHMEKATKKSKKPLTPKKPTTLSSRRNLRSGGTPQLGNNNVSETVATSRRVRNAAKCTKNYKEDDSDTEDSDDCTPKKNGINRPINHRFSSRRKKVRQK